MSSDHGPDGIELQVLIQYQLVAAMQEREHALAEAQRYAHMGSWTRNMATNVSVWRDELYRILDLDLHQRADFQLFLGRVHPEHRHLVLEALGRAEAELSDFDLELQLDDATQERWLRAQGAVTLEPDGSKRSHGVVQDITSTMRARISHDRLERRCAALELHAGADCVAVYGPDGGAQIVLGDADAAVLAWPRLDDPAGPGQIHPDDLSGLASSLALLRSPARSSTLIRYRVADGASSWRTVEAACIDATDDPRLGGVTVAFRDLVSDDSPLIPRHRDSVTGLVTHAVLLSAARAAIARAARQDWSTAIVVLDIDGFHTLNALWGDAGGDHILVEVAARLTETFRISDSVGMTSATSGSLVARVGGDRFVAVCENVPDADAARSVAQRLRQVVARPIAMPGGAELNISVGIGIAIAGSSGRKVEDRIRDAEAALRSAKHAGPNECVVLAEGSASDAEIQRSQRDALSDALSNGELVLHYQPKLSLESDRITGVEALLRWQHPERGLVPPLDFIPLAEESGLIIPIGAWVIEEACRQASAWQRRFPGQPRMVVAVNVSGRQFGPDLTNVIAAALASSEATPSQLCLEVTESILIGDAEAATETLRGLAQLGVKLAIDDFGTGYSSLSYLKRFPLHELKIDKSFVDGLGSDENDTAIISATVAMAHALGLSVVAEGVETAEQLERLRVIGCQEAQGYYISRPQPAEAITDLLAKEEGFGWRPAVSAAPTGPEPRGFRAQKVLVVDDAADVRQLARMSLAAAGFDVYEAQGGLEAIALAGTLRPDCVILDVSMPGLTGLEVCRMLRNDIVPAHCSILMLTANAGADDKVEAFSGGADDYIIKPFSPRDLVSRVRAALRREADVPIST